MKKPIIKIAAIAAVSLSVTLFFVYSSAEDAPAPKSELTLPIATVNSSSAEIHNDFPARVEGESEIEIRPQVNGKLSKIYVDEGAYVKAGQLLFKINDNTYREQLNNTTSELMMAKASVANALIEINKLKPLVQNKVVAPSQLETANTNYNMAVARVKQAEAIVADAKINLSYTSVSAPASGYISRLNKKEGSLVSTSDPENLTTLSNIKKVHVYFSLSESEFSGLKKQLSGNSFEEKLDNANQVKLILAGGEEYPVSGKLDMVNSGFDKGSGAITLRATFDNANGLLRSGNTGKIRMTFDRNNIMLIPQASTTEIQDKTFVYTLNPSNKVVKKLINISGKSGDNYIVSGGLTNGERIVLEGIEGLQNGTLVKPTKKSAVAVAIK